MTPEQRAALHRRYFLAICGDGITPEHALQLTCAYIQATEMADAMRESDEVAPPIAYGKPTLAKE